MRQNHFEQYKDNELRKIRKILGESFNEVDETLPVEIKEFIKSENPVIGNVMTRIGRCMSLVDRECINRFINQEFTEYEKNIGKKVFKTSKKPFKSKNQINTISGVINHPILNIPTYVFLEDDSYVECRQCEIL